MSRTHNITIVFNPISTGNSKKNAYQLKQKLDDHFSVTVTATEYPGHAEAIASDITAEGKPHLIISSSGDGGYNEIINGVLKNKHHSHIVTAIIPSGNANDHYQALSTDQDLADRILHQDFSTIDVLKLQTNSLTRYAHSYIGFGVTPHIGKKLMNADLNPLKEIWIVIKNLFSVRPVKITWQGHTERYDNLIFSNVDKMSKVMKLTDTASLHDGKFEIITNKRRSLKALVAHLLRASTVGLGTTRRATKTQFVLERSAHVQLDGEVFRLPKKTSVSIEAETRTLRCVA